MDSRPSSDDSWGDSQRSQNLNVSYLITHHPHDHDYNLQRVAVRAKSDVPSVPISNVLGIARARPKSL